MKNWKTNIAAIFGLTSAVLSIFHVITPEQAVQLQGVIIMYLGASAKDFDQTGKS